PGPAQATGFRRNRPFVGRGEPTEPADSGHPAALRCSSRSTTCGGRLDHGMIRPEGGSRRGPQMSATPDSTLDDLRRINADLQQRIAANHAEHEVLKLALRESDERYALAMRAINEGFYEWDVAISEMHYSPRVCELVGLAPEELRTMADWTDRIHPID